jgi:hypothetical protein
MVPFDIFRIRSVTGADVCGFLIGAVVFSNFFLLTLYVQQVLGYSALKTGLTFLATAGTVVVVAGFSQALVTTIGPRPVMAVGLALITGGMLWYTQIPVDGSFVTDLLPGYLMVGVGMAFSFIPMSIAALGGVEPQQAGLASGLINAARSVSRSPRRSRSRTRRRCSPPDVRRRRRRRAVMPSASGCWPASAGHRSSPASRWCASGHWSTRRTRRSRHDNAKAIGPTGGVA